MRSFVIFLSGFVLAMPITSRTVAAQVGCLSQSETVSAVRSGRVMAYDDAVPRKLRNSGDFLGVRLCEDGGSLVYVVSTLERNGRVTHTAVDAASGKVVGQR